MPECFYREIVGLPFAYRDATPDIIFLWAHAKEKATGTVNPLAQDSR
jgi:hypothetical protein